MGGFNDQMLILVKLSIINHETIMYFLDTSDKNI